MIAAVVGYTVQPYSKMALPWNAQMIGDDLGSANPWCVTSLVEFHKKEKILGSFRRYSCEYTFPYC